MHTALTIAGSDSSGGAGVQADLKTMLANGVFGESVITALTAQNTMGVDAVMNVPADFIEAQMKAVFTDIFPDAVKIGMTSSVDTIEAIAAGLVKYKAKNIEFIFHYPHNSKRQDVNKGAGNRGGGTPGLLRHPARKKKKGAVLEVINRLQKGRPFLC